MLGPGTLTAVPRNEPRPWQWLWGMILKGTLSLQSSTAGKMASKPSGAVPAPRRRCGTEPGGRGKWTGVSATDFPCKGQTAPNPKGLNASSSATFNGRPLLPEALAYFLLDIKGHEATSTPVTGKRKWNFHKGVRDRSYWHLRSSVSCNQGRKVPPVTWDNHGVRSNRWANLNRKKSSSNW